MLLYKETKHDTQTSIGEKEIVKVQQQALIYDQTKRLNSFKTQIYIYVFFCVWSKKVFDRVLSLQYAWKYTKEEVMQRKPS